jgi:hypothetical protein
MTTMKRAPHSDKGCWGITELELSPINSDVLESGFGHLDLCIRSLHGTPIQGFIRVAQAAALSFFATAGGKRKAAKAAARNEVRATGTTGAGAVDEAAVQAKLAAWETTSFFHPPPTGGALDPHQGHPAQVKIVVVAADRANAEAEARGRAD